MAPTQEVLYAGLDLDLSWSERELPERERTKHVHRLHPYLGKFIPQLVEVLLERYVPRGGRVLDPFAGSGTTLVQSLESGHDATGGDIAAFNCLLMRVKTARYNEFTLERELRDALSKLEINQRGDSPRDSPSDCPCAAAPRGCRIRRPRPIEEAVNPLSPRAPRLTWLTAAFVTTFCALVASVGADAHWLAALGQWIVRLGEIPSGVPYATASSAGWDNVPVLGELFFHALEAGLGDRGLVLALVVAVAIALGFVAFDMRREDVADAPSALALLLVAVAAASSMLVVRNQLFSLALFPILVFLLRSQVRVPTDAVWLVVPLVALWSNLHGGVLVGVAVAGAYLLFHRLSRTPVVAVSLLGASLAALFVTPALLGTGDYYRGVLGSEAASAREGLWAPLSLGNPLDIAFLAAGVPLVLAALASRPKVWELAAIAGLSLMTFQSARNGVWLVLFAATPAARWLTGSRQWRLCPPRYLTAALAVLLAGLLALGLSRTPAPSAAGQPLRERAAAAAGSGPILADDINAEALALDGRQVWIANPLDAFRGPDQRLYLDWIAGRPAGDALLSSFSVALVKLDSVAQTRLARAAWWHEAARDGQAALYVRARR